MAPSKLRAHLVSQTHWDREWYLPFEEFRFRLVRLMDRVLHLFETQPDYKHFVCDGQTILLDDYLAIRPEREEELRRHIRSGRLVIGPWHVLPDEFLVSAESLVRNLLMARRVAARFGPMSEAGYVPDPFGHVAQLPQILRGFGIDTFIFLRGMPPADKWGTEFHWEAPDRKSTVLAIWMKNIYFNASLLGYEAGWGDSLRLAEPFGMERALDQVRGQVEDLGAWTRRGVVLLNNGCDHTPPQYEIPDVLREANKRIPGTRFVHSTYDAFARDVKRSPGKLRTMRDAELRSSRYIVILPGVLSTRMILKQWNRECEALLERWAEPATAAARHLGGEDHTGSLVQAWRLLLENHPHDSICGCSVDAVHREMLVRFEKVAQIARSVRDFQLECLESRINTAHESANGALLCWNALGGARRGPLNATVTLPDETPENFRIVDSAGQDVPFQTGTVTPRSETGYLYFNSDLKDVEIALDAPQAGWGYRTFHLLPAGKTRPDTTWCRGADSRGIETDHLRLRFHANGSFDLREKASGVTHRNVLLFEDTEDAGDEYDYSHAAHGGRLSTRNARARVRLAARGPLYVDYALTIPWRLPEALTADRKRRARRNVDATLHVTIRVWRRSPRLDVTLEFHNRARDHRLRALVPGPARVDESRADGHFAIRHRPINVVNSPDHDGLEPTIHHLRHWVAMTGDKAGMAVLSSQLTEYEVLKGRGGTRTIALTLLRSVGWLSRGDLLTRPNFAGPVIETPDAQCLGPFRTTFAILPLTGPDPERELIPEAESFAVPVHLRWTGCHSGDLPADHAWLKLAPDDLLLSTWKPAEDGEGSVVRFYNPAGKTRQGRLAVAPPLTVQGPCDLKEEPLGKAPGGASPAGARSRTGPFQVESFRVTDASHRVGRRRK